MSRETEVTKGAETESTEDTETEWTEDTETEWTEDTGQDQHGDAEARGRLAVATPKKPERHLPT
jgi:hypothetical protein